MLLTGIECLKHLNDMTKLNDETSSSFWNHYHSDFDFDGENFSGLKMLGDSHYNQSLIKRLLYGFSDKLFQLTYHKYSYNKLQKLLKMICLSFKRKRHYFQEIAPKTSINRKHYIY